MYRGNRIVIPRSLTKEILEVLHAAHQGINACKIKGKENVYWPGMMKEIEEIVSQCKICQDYGRSNPNEPLTTHEIPKIPWQKLGGDL